MEVWKPIEGCDGYEVSNLGRVRSLKRKTPRILKPFYFFNSDYLALKLRIDGKNKLFFVHRLVAQAFIPNPDNKPCVNHINGVKTDNRVENLEWATYSENMKHAVKIGLIAQGGAHRQAKLTAEQVIYIRENPDQLRLAQLGNMFGVAPQVISRVQIGEKYKNVGGKIREKQKLGEYRRIPNNIRNQIRAEYKKSVRGQGSIALAKKYGVSKATVLRCIHELTTVDV